MMAGNPNWWIMNNTNSMHPQSFQPQLSSINSQHQFVYGSSNIDATASHEPVASAADNHNPSQDFPVRSLSQLLMGFGSEEDRYGASLFQQQKKLDNWEDQVLNLNPYNSFTTRSVVPSSAVNDVKQEHELSQSSTCQLYDHQNHDDEVLKCPNSSTTVRPCNRNMNWPLQHQLMPVSSPTSCLTTSSNNILNFSGNKAMANKNQHQRNQDHSSECNSTSNGGVSKKARVQQSSAQHALKVRKEKLGDRITALHQLVSPFGKTDTASVLSEAIGYIRFLQSQIEALSAPYIRNTSASTSTSHHIHSELRSDQGMLKDLRSRGLCLVPMSCTQNVGNEGTGADYWAPAAFGGGF